MRIKGGREERSYSSLINPEKPIPANISSITGITDEMVSESPVFGEIVEEIMPLFEGAALVCHNAGFDLGFLHNHFTDLDMPVIEAPVIDTLFLARKYFDFPSNKLGNIAKALDIYHEDAHRAMGDVKVTKEIFNYFINELKDNKNIMTLADLLKVS
jgi:ATP-dependent DNA helicase DinG